MSLRYCPLLYVFLETCDLDRQRETFEAGFGLPVIELETRPNVRHGVVKYDAGTVVLSLNLSPPSRFRGGGSDGLVTVFDEAPPGWAGTDATTDAHGHRYAFRRCATDGQHIPSVAELRLAVDDLAASVGFYRDVLGLAPITGAAAAFDAGAAALVLEPGRDTARHDTYLLVFHTRVIDEAYKALAARGVTFRSRTIGSREFGRTVRFADPSGHRLCLYEPSAESLRSASGRKVRQILAGCDAAVPMVPR